MSVLWRGAKPFASKVGGGLRQIPDKYLRRYAGVEVEMKEGGVQVHSPPIITMFL